MPLAIFGIENTALNLAATLAILVLVAIWLALIVYTFTDARRRISDPFLIGCATAASLFPFVGTMVYTILRPPEFLEDVRERETEVRAAEVRLRHLEGSSCHKCGFPTEADFMRCPSCRTRLKDECPTCSKPVGLDWKLCPYCETQLVAPKRSSRSGSSKGSRSKDGGRSKDQSRDKSQGEPKRRRSKPSSKTAQPESGRSSSRESGRSSSPERSSSRSKSGSSSRSDETVESAAARPSPESDPAKSNRSSQRTPRSARRKTVAPDEDSGGGSKPINSGDTPAPSRSRESR